LTVSVVLDTSALLGIFEHRVDIFSSLESLFGKVRVVIPSFILDELKELEKRKRHASAAVRLIRQKGVEVVDAPGKGDQGIVEFAIRYGYCVLTNDMRLKSELRKHGVTVIFLRNMSKLKVEGVDSY